MRDSLVLFVTRDGHSRALALDLGARLGSEAREIGDLVGRKGLFGFLRSGAQASRGAATPISDPQVDLSSVRTVVLVQPVWASAICPPIRSYLRAHSGELAGKRIGLFASAASTRVSDFRAKFELEFGASLPLAACAVVNKRDDLAARERILADFVAELAKN
jgi:hypothetical protein